MKKILALLLALIMVMSMTPVFAEETGTEGDSGATDVFVPSPENYDAIGNETKVTTGWNVAAGVPYACDGNFYSTKFTGGNLVVYKIALPAPANGQTYDRFVVRFGVGSTNGGATYKMPGEDWDMTQSLTGTEWYTTITNAKNASTLKAYEGNIIYGTTANGYKNSYTDITEYAKECWYAGQEYMYLAVGCVKSTSGACQTTVSDSDYTQFAPTILYSFKTVEAPAPLENTAEAMKALGNETLIPNTNGFKSAGGTVTAASGNWTSTFISGKGNIAIVKIDLPEIPNGKTIGNVAFRYGVSSSQNKTTGVYTMASNLRVYKMPGTDWTMSGSIADTDWYKKVTVAASASAYEANDNSLIYTVGDTGSDAYTLAYANITSYIKDCYANGQTYCYLAYGDWNSTRNTGSTSTSDSSYTKAGVKPRIYYSFEDLGALELVSSTPAKGAFTTAKEATFTFNNKLASATATVDGVEYSCTVDASQVKVTFADAGEYTVQVTAKDTARQTVTSDAVKVRVGYESQKLTDSVASSYYVSGNTAAMGTYAPSVHSTSTGILSIPLPTLEAGKKLKEFKLKFITNSKFAPDYYRLLKIPVDGSEVLNLVNTTGEVAEGKININKYVAGAAGEYKADLGNFKTETTDIENLDNSATCFANYADLTNYANECIERGQTKMLVGFTSRWTNSIIGIGDSSHTTANRFHYAYWTTEDADFSVNAAKFVAGEGTYKFTASIANYGDEEIAADLYIAQYDEEGTLISVSAKNVTVDAVGEFIDFESETLTVDANAATVKAFIWTNNQDPLLIGDAIVDLK